MGRKQRTPKAEGQSRRSPGSAEPEAHQPKLPRLVDIATVLACLIAVAIFYKQFGSLWTLLVVLGTLALFWLERILLSPDSRLRRFLSARLFRIAAVASVILFLVILTLARGDNSSSRKNQETDSSKQTLVLVADFDAPSPMSVRNHRVAEVLRSRLTQAFQKYPDVQVAPLDRTITERDGSRLAREQGRRQAASIVIWGWYGITRTSVVMSVNFEVLAPPPAPFRNPGEEVGSDRTLRKYSLSDLERFQVQERLSSEMVYLSELTVGVVRFAKHDMDGAISHLGGAVTASQGKSTRARAVAHFYRAGAYLFRAQRRLITDDPRGKHDIESSIADSGSAIRLESESRYDMPAYYNRGMAYRLQGDLQRAISDFNEAVRLKPDAENYRERGKTYALKHDFRNALADLTKAIHLDNSADSYAARGSAYAKQKNWQKALADFTKAIELQSDPEFYILRAEAHGAKGDFERALTDYTQAIQRKPNEAEGYFTRGTAYLHHEDYDPAVVDLSKAVELAPNDNKKASRYYMNRGIAYRSKGDLDRALSDFNWIIDRLPQLNDVANIDWKAYVNRASVYEAKKEPIKAIADYSQALRIRPKNPELYFRRARLHYGQRDFRSAIEDATNAIKLRPDVIAGYELRADSYMAIGDTERALLDLSGAIKRQPKNTVLYLKRGAIHAIRGEKQSAMYDLQHVLDTSRDPQLREAAREDLEALNSGG